MILDLTKTVMELIEKKMMYLKRRSEMLKIKKIFTLLLLVTFLLSGCGQQPSELPEVVEPTKAVDQPTKEVVSPTEKPAEVVEEPTEAPKLPVSLIVQSGPFERAVVGGVEICSAETGIPIEVIPLAYGNLREKILVEGMAGSGEIDIFSVDNAWLAELVDYLVPISDKVVDSDIDLSVYVPPMIESSRLPSMYSEKPAGYKLGDGELYGIPVRSGTQVLAYRTDLISEPPRTMDEYMAMAVEQTTGGRYGTIISGTSGVWIVNNFLPFLWSFGGDVLSPTWDKSVLDSPEAIRAAEFYVELSKAVPEGFLAMGQDEAHTMLQQDLAASWIIYSGNIGRLEDPEQSLTKGKWNVVPVPADSNSGLKVGLGGLGQWLLSINKFGGNQESAFEVIQCLTRPDIQLMMAVDFGNGPTVSSVYTDPSYLAKYPYGEEVLLALNASSRKPVSQYWTKIEDILSTELGLAFLGEKTPEEAMLEAKLQIDKFLADK